jgi:HTH-type transcriptional regulator / antitoxin MqsA
MESSLKALICPSCGTACLVLREEKRRFAPPTGEVVVNLVSSACSNCGAKVTTTQQRTANLAALAARKAAYGEYLTGEEVLSLRKKYGITQQQASEAFGRGKIAFSRYENESSFPDLAMTRLMRLALNDPRVMQRLASSAGIALPLLDKRLNEALLPWLKATLRKSETTEGSTRVVSAWLSASQLLADLCANAHSTGSAATKVSAPQGKISSAANDERFALAA